MPKLKKLSKQEERDRKAELTEIRRLRAKGWDGRAKERMYAYRRRYWVPHNEREADGRFKRKRRSRGDQE